MEQKENIYSMVVEQNHISNPHLVRRTCTAFGTFYCGDRGLEPEAVSFLKLALATYPKAWKSRRDFIMDQMKAGNAACSLSTTKTKNVTVSFGCVRNHYMHSLVPTERQALRIMEKVLNEGPKLDEATLKLVKGIMLRINSNVAGTPKFIASRALKQAYLPDMVPGEYPCGDDEKIAALTPEKISATLKAILSSPCVYATMMTKPIDAQLKKIFKPQPMYKRGNYLLDHSKCDGSNLSISHQGLQSAFILRAFSTPYCGAEDPVGYYAGSVAATVLSGTDSILFKLLREEGGYAYTPHYSILSDNTGAVYFSTDPSKASQAMKAVDDCLVRASGLIDEAMVESAKEEVKSAYRSLLENTDTTLLASEITHATMGFEKDIASCIPYIDQVTVEQVRKILDSYKGLGGVILTPDQSR